MTDDAFLMMNNFYLGNHNLLFPDALKNALMIGMNEVLRSPDFKAPFIAADERLHVSIGVKLVPVKVL